MNTNKRGKAVRALPLLFALLFILCSCSQNVSQPTTPTGEPPIIAAPGEQSTSVADVPPTKTETPSQDADTPTPDIDTTTPEAEASPLTLAAPTYEPLQIIFMDVGQGDCALVLAGEHAMLIDAGNIGQDELILGYLGEYGVTALDYLVLTHPHADHIGGASGLIRALDSIDALLMPDVIHTTKTFEDLLDAIEDNNIAITIPKPGDAFHLGEAEIQVIAPNGLGYADLNNYSLVLRVTYGQFAFLFMGDAEKESEAEILSATYELSADVIKAGHHGSATSSSKAFIQAVSPEYAVISCGEGNSYGHPADQTLATFSALGIEIKRTDENGRIVFFCDGDTLSCTVYPSESKPSTPVAEPTEAPRTSAVEDAPTSTAEQSITVYVTKTGAKYHADGCRYLSKSKISISLENAKQKYEPCSVCNPPR